MIIAATGHRPNKLGYEYDMDGPFSDYILSKMDYTIKKYNPTHVISGMALGVDTIWALAALKHKIPLICACAFNGMEMKWPSKSIKLYYAILKRAYKVVYVSLPPYSAKKMQVRNEWMVDNCSLLLAVHNGDRQGGTFNCIQYALDTGRNIDFINIKHLYV